MKVLQVTNSLRSGGAEKLIADTTNLYANENIYISVLLMDGTKTPFLEKVSSNQIPIFSLGSGIKNIYNPLNIFKVLKYLKEYDIVHVHLFPALYWVAFAKILSFSKCKMVVTEHNSTNRRRDNAFFKLLDPLIYKKYDQIVTISKSVDENLKKHLGSKFKNFYKINNGIDLHVFNNALPYSKKELNYKENDNLLIQVSSFTPQKDQETLIRVMPLLPENYKLILVGTGPLESQLKDLASELNIVNKVHFMGIRSDVPRLLKSVDIVLLSSNYEGLSLSSVEGMACGKPFIASDAPGLTEVVENAGLLFPIGDIDQLKDTILKLTSDETFYQNLVNDCLKRANEFDVNKMVQKHITLYKNLLGR